jgi:D-arabinose 1-dehydrogenase-like Zn-dependent alcohol dehydrogenase
MKAALLEEFGSSMIVKQVDKPKIGVDDVLIRVRSNGICGTDLKIISGKFPELTLPRILGHEISGEICEIGKNVKNVELNDRVVVHNHLSCGECRYCKMGLENICQHSKGTIGFQHDGGLAEFVSVPANDVLVVGEGVSFRNAAILGDAIATPYHALRQKAGLRDGQVLVILGVGGLGLHAVQIGKIMNAKVIAIDLSVSHLKKAKELGADVILRLDGNDINEVIRKESQGYGADIVMDIVGQQETFERCLDWLAPAGMLLVLGYDPLRPFSLPSFNIVLMEKIIVGCRSNTRQDLAEVISLTEKGRIKPVVGKVFPLDDINEAYKKLQDGDIIGRMVIEV